jgi:hypothetical protein
MFKWLMGRRHVPAHRGLERRAAERYSCNDRLNENLIVSVGPSAWPALVQDISATGVGLVLGMRHDPGSTLPVRLANPNQSVRCPMLAQVVHTARQPDGYWHTGCTFEGYLTSTELQALLAQ